MTLTRGGYSIQGITEAAMSAYQALIGNGGIIENFHFMANKDGRVCDVVVNAIARAECAMRQAAKAEQWDGQTLWAGWPKELVESIVTWDTDITGPVGGYHGPRHWEQGRSCVEDIVGACGRALYQHFPAIDNLRRLHRTLLDIAVLFSKDIHSQHLTHLDVPIEKWRAGITPAGEKAETPEELFTAFVLSVFSNVGERIENEGWEHLRRISGTHEPEPSDQAFDVTGEPEADGCASALATPEAAIVTTTGQAAGVNRGDKSGTRSTAVFQRRGPVEGTMNLELPVDVQEKLARAFGRLDDDISDRTLKLAETFRRAGPAGDLRKFVLYHRKKFPFQVQPQTGDLRELLLLHTKRWLTLKMDLIAAEWTKLSLDEQEFRSQMDRLEWALSEEAVVKFSVCSREAGDCTPANELIGYAEKELRLTLVVRGRGWCRRNQARALLMTCHRGTPRKLEQDAETASVALRKKPFEATCASTEPLAKDNPGRVSTTNEPKPSGQAPGMTGEPKVDDTASALAISEVAIPPLPAREQTGTARTKSKPSDEPEPAGVANGNRTGRPILVQENAKGSMDRPSQTDPIWTIGVTQKDPIPVTRLSGEIVWINRSTTSEPDDAVLPPEDELRIAEVTLTGRSELRSEIETAFGGTAWPLASAIVEPFRRYATKVFDVNAAAYRKAASTQGRDSNEVLRALVRNLLKDVFGSEWESSSGEQVTRTDWQHGIEGWKGREVVVIAGNDPDKNCLYHQLIGDAVTYRYRFHATLPAPIPGEPPGINVSNLEWWQYIGLNERHNLAMAIKPYLEDRMAHWQFVYKAASATDSSAVRAGAERTTSEAAAGTESAVAAKRRSVVLPILTQKRWTRGKWATKSGVGKNCVYEYLNGKRNPGYENRKAMADVLELKVVELPD